MSKPVKDFVNKEWAASAKEILTGSYQEMTSLFDRLLTLTSSHTQALCRQTARDRLEDATKRLTDGIKYGWAHGINGDQVRFTRPDNSPPNRRVGALLPLAIAAGTAIGKLQREKINRAHRHAEHAGQGVHPSHATHPSA